MINLTDDLVSMLESSDSTDNQKAQALLDFTNLELTRESRDSELRTLQFLLQRIINIPVS